MLSVDKLKCSWPLAASIISVVGLISVVHLFLFPVVPSFDYLSVRKAQNSCSPVNGSSEETKPHIDFDIQFPANSHDAVVYRGAQWKASIGRWLSGCDSVAEEISVTEVTTTFLVEYLASLSMLMSLWVRIYYIGRL